MKKTFDKNRNKKDGQAKQPDYLFSNMASETKGFGLGSLVSNRFSSEPPSIPPAPNSHETYPSSIGGSSRPIITEDVEIKGELAFSGELEFNGRFEGSLDSDGSLLVGEKAMIKGGIAAESAVIAGKIQGDIRTVGKVHLKPEAMIYGDIRASVIIVEEGAYVEGKITTTTTERAAADFDGMFVRLGSKTRGSRSTSSDS